MHTSWDELLALCGGDDARRYQQTDEHTDFAKMNRPELLAIAVMRVHSVLRWAAEVMDNYPQGTDRPILPRFVEKETAAQLRLSWYLLRFFHMEIKWKVSPRFKDPFKSSVARWETSAAYVDFAAVFGWPTSVESKSETLTAVSKTAGKVAIEEEDSDELEVVTPLTR